LKMKNENICRGNGKIQVELKKSGIRLDKRTIAGIIEYFRRKGKVKKGLTWSRFIQSHLPSLYGMDFFTLDTILRKRFYIFFIIHLQTRQIVRYPVTTSPTKRLIGSARREAFDWFILFNETQIRNIMAEYVGYYNEKRPHQGIAQKVSKGYIPQKQGNIITYPILSGLHHHYERFSD